MDQIIVGVLALVALWWAVRGRRGKPVRHVCLSPSVSCCVADGTVSD